MRLTELLTFERELWEFWVVKAAPNVVLSAKERYPAHSGLLVDLEFKLSTIRMVVSQKEYDVAMEIGVNIVIT
ncbi:hypothetical protein CHS0354_010543 [Potamilus streckersoni]|uniref:Uncharacterized protein n=1 Tax=Potamilus streckersoni TaxID=2493646 RepID=A0AAE0S5P6_9BIVA|nr:hypothetical protein CHS0354_010543 [Potamilus streckersoni]